MTIHNEQTLRPVRIPLTQGYEALIDPDDVEKVGQYKWCLKKDRYTAYAKRTITVDGKQTVQFMHRLIMDAPADKQVDHINGDGLDNRKVNLRLCSQMENRRNLQKSVSNSSGFKGVHYDNQFGKWKATITLNNRPTFICYSECLFCAAEAYNQKAKEFYGEFANINHTALCVHLLRVHDDAAYTLLRNAVLEKVQIPKTVAEFKKPTEYNEAMAEILTLLDTIYGKTHTV